MQKVVEKLKKLSFAVRVEFFKCDRCLCECGRWQVGAVQTAGIHVLAHQRWDVKVTILKWSGSPGWEWAVKKKSYNIVFVCSLFSIPPCAQLSRQLQTAPAIPSNKHIFPELIEGHIQQLLSEDSSSSYPETLNPSSSFSSNNLAAVFHQKVFVRSGFKCDGSFWGDAPVFRLCFQLSLFSPSDSHFSSSINISRLFELNQRICLKLRFKLPLVRPGPLQWLRWDFDILEFVFSWMFLFTFLSSCWLSYVVVRLLWGSRLQYRFRGRWRTVWVFLHTRKMEIRLTVDFWRIWAFFINIK